MSDTPRNPLQPTDGQAVVRLAQHGRVDYRLLATDGPPYSATNPIPAEIKIRLVEDLAAYRASQTKNGRAIDWADVAARLGISIEALRDVRKGRARSDDIELLTRIDTFLAEERARVGRFSIAGHARIGITEAIFGTLRACVQLNSIGVIIGSPGTGKSAHLRAFARERGGCLTIRIDEKNAGAVGVAALLVAAIGGGALQLVHHSSRRRLFAIREWIRRTASPMILIDEAQKLDAGGLELIRDIHDTSDPSGQGNVPIALFGDQAFLKLIFGARAGQRSPISPQMVRRMRPVLNIDTDCQLDGGGLYSTADIEAIVANHRARLLTPSAVRWLRDLANIIEYGALGNAMSVLQLAVALAQPPGTNLDFTIDVEHLRQALELTFGRSAAQEIDTRAEGSLMRRVG